jgi:PleD family two-component response regulator
MNDRLLYPSRILVVDDQEANALLLQAILVRAGYSAVGTIIDPMSVAARCREESPDCCCSTGTCRDAAAPRSSRTSPF